MKAKKLTKLTLDADAIAALATLTTARKRGDFVSELILEAYHHRDPAAQIGAQVAADIRRLVSSSITIS
jgi:hypothetical protein